MLLFYAYLHWYFYYNGSCLGWVSVHISSRSGCGSHVEALRARENALKLLKAKLTVMQLYECPSNSLSTKLQDMSIILYFVSYQCEVDKGKLTAV